MKFSAVQRSWVLLLGALVLTRRAEMAEKMSFSALEAVVDGIKENESFH